MSYQEFLDAVLQGIKACLGERKEVTINRILKNNSIYLDGLTIKEETRNISPTIYLNSYYPEYMSGKSLGEIILKLLEVYEKNRLEQNIDITFFTDFNRVGEKVVFKLINYHKNKELLNDIPHIKYLDLAIVFYCFLYHDRLGTANITITNKHLQLWGISEKELFLRARENTPKLLRYDLRSMEEVILEICRDNSGNNSMYSGLELRQGDSRHGECGTLHDTYDEMHHAESVAKEVLQSIKDEKDNLPMYVLSNHNRLNGAACILYQGILDGFANLIEQDLYILPSSIHEVIIIPASFQQNPGKLQEMVREVNRTQLEAEEILSDCVYYYSREKACLSCKH